MAETAPQLQGDLSGASDRTRVWFVALAALIFSLLGVISREPSIATIANYSKIAVGIVFAFAYVFMNLSNVRLRAADLVFFAALVLAVPIALIQLNQPVDIFGNFIRASFLIIAVIFWRVRVIDTDKIVSHLYSAFWKVALVATLFTLLAPRIGIHRIETYHMTMLIFMFAFAWCNRRFWAVLAIVVMIIVTGKQASLVAILAIIIAYSLLYGKQASSLLFFAILVIFAIFAVTIFDGLSSLGENFAELEQFFSALKAGNFNYDLFNRITSNRYLEYQSIFQNWGDNGIPFFGRGLGTTVLVELGKTNQFVERSTIHNSYLVVFQTTGVFGILFLAHYVFAPLWRLRKTEPEIVLAGVGYVTYALFSNSLLQDPSLVFCLALAKRLAETYEDSAAERTQRYGPRARK